jgi:hypothetical protein
MRTRSRQILQSCLYCVIARWRVFVITVCLICVLVYVEGQCNLRGSLTSQRFQAVNCGREIFSHYRMSQAVIA